MNQLSPQEAFPIVYVLADPNDSATYYVRSVMRNSSTGAIVQINGANFVNLTDGGNRRFTRTIQAPNDPSGQGFWVDIVTTVYTDSGYTTKSENYFEQCDKYLVQQRWNYAQGAGGGSLNVAGHASGEGFDLKTLKKALREVLEEFDFPKVELDPISAGLRLALERLLKISEKTDSVKQALVTIKIPEMDPYFERAIKTICEKIIENKTREFDPEEIHTKLDKIPTEFPKPPDYSPEFSEMMEALTFLKKYIESVKGPRDNSMDTFLAEVTNRMTEAKQKEGPVGNSRFEKLKA